MTVLRIVIFNRNVDCDPLFYIFVDIRTNADADHPASCAYVFREILVPRYVWSDFPRAFPRKGTWRKNCLAV